MTIPALWFILLSGCAIFTTFVIGLLAYLVNDYNKAVNGGEMDADGISGFDIGPFSIGYSPYPKEH